MLTRRFLRGTALRRAFHASARALAPFRILASDPIDPICGKLLRDRGCEVVECAKTPTPEALLAQIGEYDGLVIRSATTVTKEVLAAGRRLKVIGRAGVGVDNIDVPAATNRGVVVMNTPGGNTTSTAELTFSLIMALARNIPAAVSSLKAGRWDRSKYTGTELAGKVIGVVGLGRIGREVARWCQAFGMTVVGYDPVMSAQVAAASGVALAPLDEVWARSDFITVHTPKTPETTNLICAATLAKCKDGVRIVNVARGGIVNEADLLAALKSGKVAGAALDVFSKEPPPPEAAELLAHPGVLCTPHLGASTAEAQVNVAKDIAVQMVDALENKAFVGVVNASNLAFLSRPDLATCITLAERLGSLQGQLLRGSLRRISMTLQGPLVGDGVVAAALKTAVLKGLLGVTHGSHAVTWVNVPLLAKELGIDFVDFTSSKPGAYSNLITLAFETEAATAVPGLKVKGEKRTISAALFTPTEARVVDIDGFPCEVNPSGDILFWNNKDQPGVLAQITSVVGAAGINIAHFGLGRAAVGGSALGVLTTDTPVPPAVQAQLSKLPNVHEVRTVSLPPFGAAPKLLADGGGASGAQRPSLRPASPNFGSGPTKKRPGWSLNALGDAALGRSHRSALGKEKLKRAVEKTRELLALPKDYRVGIVPASDTGAYEMAMWGLLGPRGVDSVHFESFGAGWHEDLTKQLKIKDVVEHTAPYGTLPDLSKTSPERDILFTWNGTTSGVCVPNGGWISDARKGLTLCDATSAVFSQPVDFKKCDVTTYSWQKVLGGEGAHGMLILSSRAVERLETYAPPWPLPKIFRMAKKGKVDESIFQGDTINTPSMLCVEDYLDSLAWAESQGGVKGLTARANANLAIVDNFVRENSWIQFLAKDPATRSNTSICLTLDLPPAKVKALTTLLEKEGVAFDIGHYRDAPPGLRIWGGATVEPEDMHALMGWLKWGYTVIAEKKD